MSSEDTEKIKQDIDDAFSSVFGGGHGVTASLAGKAAAKLYEIKVLAELLTRLSEAGYRFQLANAAAGFKGAPGPINNSYTYIKVMSENIYVADIRTDIEFIGLSSYQLAGKSNPTNLGEYHELDILVCEKELENGSRPRSDQVYIGVECKHWAAIPKKLLREILGVRRELSFRSKPNSSMPVTIGSAITKSNPPTKLIFAVSKDGTTLKHEWCVPADEFEIDIWPVSV